MNGALSCFQGTLQSASELLFADLLSVYAHALSHALNVGRGVAATPDPCCAEPSRDERGDRALTLGPSHVNDSSLLDLWFEVLGLFGSGIAGVFLLGTLTRRTGPVAGWCGLVASAVAVWSVSMFTDISGLAFAAVGIITCLATGFLVGIVDRRPATQ